MNTNKYNYQKKYPFGDFHLRFQNERLKVSFFFYLFVRLNIINKNQINNNKILNSLKKLGEFEKMIGIEFTHCGLLRKALSHSHPTDPAFELTSFFFDHLQIQLFNST